MTLFEDILKSRGLGRGNLDDFLYPNYDKLNDPFLLPDMKKAVDRIKLALKNDEQITIYGDYDIDGLTATTVLLDSLKLLGFKKVDTFIPNRFVEGYGLTVEAIESIAKRGTNLIITVDCGSLSHEPIARANELDVDVIVTDHHNAAEKQPPAIAVINPKRIDSEYPFKELAGVGVAFKLVQALKTKIKGLENGQEKWLLDMVALGTVCDVVPLVNENRTLVYYGLKVLSKTRRLGVKALCEVANLNLATVSARDLGFILGPRLNAAGRLETAQHSLELLNTKDKNEAYRLANLLDEMNRERRLEQDMIFEEASLLAEKDDSKVLVLSAPNWNHGVVGIVAAKVLEKYKKPTFILQELDDMVKGSARSFGDFSAADAVRHAEKSIIKGGGHKLAAGVSLPVGKIADFRSLVNEYYDLLKLPDQSSYLVPEHAAETENLDELSEELVGQIKLLEPFGHGNTEPAIKLRSRVKTVKLMGSEFEHVKLTLEANKKTIAVIRFKAPEEYKSVEGKLVDIWLTPTINEWQNYRSVEGRILHLEVLD